MKLLLFLLPVLISAQTLEKDVVYSQGAHLMMDVARPAGAGPFPAVLALHGGNFENGDRAQVQAAIQRLAAHGYVVAAIDYRLAPRSQFPVPLEDAKAVVRFLRANAQRFAIDPNRIAAVGDTAGGHLALMLAFAPGQTDIVCAVAFDAPAALPATLVGGDLENARAEHILASPIHWITPQAPPVLLLGESREAPALLDRLKQAGVTAEMSTERSEARMIAFLDRHLGLNPPRGILLLADHGARGQIVAIEWPSGRELWTVPNHNGHDVQPLPGGHVLYTLGPEHKVVEMDADHKPVWTYGPDEGLQHPISAQRLPNGNTLIGDAQLGKVIEIDRARTVVWKYESPDLANMRMRNSRRIENGNTLISVEAAGKIIEVNPTGEIVWSFTGEGGPKRRPYKGYRLPNGNTLITMTDPGELVEVTPAGKVVRSIAGEKNDIRMIWASGFDVLPDGNLIISDYQGHRAVEVGTDGKVLHEVRYPTRSTASIAIVP